MLLYAVHASDVANAGAVESLAFQTGSGMPWTWSCGACAPAGCSIVAPNKQPTAPPLVPCIGTAQLTLSTSPLGIGDGPGSYADRADCTWLISASSPITVRFGEFSTEPDYDHVKLYDGASPSSPLLQSFSGAAVPAAVTSTGGSLTIRFTSDGSTVGVNTSAGFTATLTSVSVDAALQLVGTVPATLGDLRCAGSVTSMCVAAALPHRSMVLACLANAQNCRDLSGQNLTGQLPDSITRLRVLHTMCACTYPSYELHAELAPAVSPVVPWPAPCLPRHPPPLFRLLLILAARGRSNIGRNSFTGKFPSCFSSMPAITYLYVALICQFAPLSTLHVRHCGRLAASNKFSGTLPTNILQITSLRQLCAALCESRLLQSVEALANVCRDVRFNFFQGDVTTIARMNGTIRSVSTIAAGFFPTPCCSTPILRLAASSHSEGHAPAPLSELD